MEVINESLEVENKEVLPQILMRIFSVCKVDPDFPLKGQIESIELETNTINSKLKKQEVLIKKVIAMRDDLSNRLQDRRQDNFEIKSRLLEELGSEI